MQLSFYKQWKKEYPAIILLLTYICPNDNAII